MEQMEQNKHITDMNKKAIAKLANAYQRSAQDYYFGNISNVERLEQSADMLGCILDQLNRTENGLITPLMRIVAHYAATSTDTDKEAVISAITRPTGVCALLERVQADGDIIAVWADFIETLTGAIQDSREAAA